MGYDILKNLGLDRENIGSPDFLKTLERMQREAWENLQRSEPLVAASARDDDTTANDTPAE